MMVRPLGWTVIALCALFAGNAGAAPPPHAGGGKGGPPAHAGGDDRGGNDKGGGDHGKSDRGPPARSDQRSDDRGGGSRTNGPPERDQGHRDQGGRDRGDRDDRGGSRHADGRFRDDHRIAVRDYYSDVRHCPPGLAKKRNGCMPPGQAKKWHVGRRLPREVVYYDLPRDLVIRLPPLSSGYRYARVGADILQIAVGTGLVIDAIEDLGRM